MHKLNRTVTIAGRVISDEHAPFIIAELSGNHSQNLELAKKMLYEAARVGVAAVKLQTYTADTITLDCDSDDFIINDENSLWKGERLYDLYDRAHTPWSWHAELFTLAESLGLIIFSSPFDESSVDFLESLNAPCYKIASFELNHHPLLRKVAQTKKPVIMSTGMATLREIEAAVNVLTQNGCTELVLLKCTSAYPAPLSAANLKTLADMKQRFGCPVGLSDHIQGVASSIVAAALGANVIERHFVLDKNSEAVDAAFSSDANEFELLVNETRHINQVMGEVVYGAADAERDSLKYRRSIYVSKTIEPGQCISHENIKIVRPGFGLSPEYWDVVLGRRVLRQVNKGEALSWVDISSGTDHG